jgi:hypothetical protein
MSVSNVTIPVNVPNLQALFGNTAPKNIDIDKIFKADPQKWSYTGHGYTQAMPDGTSVYVTQPAGTGGEIFITYTDKNGMSVTFTASDVKGSLQFTDVDVEGGGTMNGKSAASMEEFLMDMMINDDAMWGNKKRKGNAGAGSASASAGGASGAGAAGSAVLDPNEWMGGGESWFVEMAIAMGEILKKRAVELKELLNQIKQYDDDPPHGLTMELQGKTQEMQFLQTAFTTVLNTLGETIKKSLEQAR